MPTSCPDLKYPVPCGDGQCHTDYISCLRVRAHRMMCAGVWTDSEPQSYSEALLQEDALARGIRRLPGEPSVKDRWIAEWLVKGMLPFNMKGMVAEQ